MILTQNPCIWRSHCTLIKIVPQNPRYCGWWWLTVRRLIFVTFSIALLLHCNGSETDDLEYRSYNGFKLIFLLIWRKELRHKLYKEDEFYKYYKGRNLILKMKISVWCAQFWLKLNYLQKTVRKQCFLRFFEVSTFQLNLSATNQ